MKKIALSAIVAIVVSVSVFQNVLWAGGDITDATATTAALELHIPYK